MTRKLDGFRYVTPRSTGMPEERVVVLLLGLLTGGGLLNDRQIRALVNDEVSQSNYRTSVILGFWVAMVTALVLYLFPNLLAFMGGDPIYTTVTFSVTVAVLKFAYLEYRAHRDAYRPA